MTHSKHYHPVWRQAAAALLLLSLILGMSTAQAADALAILPLTVFDAGAYPAGLVYGPEQSLWVSLSGSAEIGQVSGTGTSTIALPDPAAVPWDMTIGADQALWFSAGNLNQIMRLGPGGALSEYSLGAGSASAITVALGQDRALWFTEPEANRISRLTLAGDLTHFDLPHANSKPLAIISAQNGDLWFTEWDGYRIGKITLQGEISEVDLPNKMARPVDLMVDADGSIWVIFNMGKTVARYNPQNGSFTYYPLATQSPSLSDITLGPDNRIWFIGTETVGSFELVDGAPANLAEEALLNPVFSYQGRSQIITGPDNDLIFTTANTSQVYRSAQRGDPALRDLQIFITYQPPLLLAAGEFFIDADIVNWTNTAATGVTINLELDESIQFVRTELPGSSCVDHGLSVQCTLPSLGAGARTPARFVMKTDRASAIPSPRTLRLDVSSAEGDYQPANNRVVLFTTIQTSLDYFNDFSEGADDFWSHPVTSTPVAGLDVLGLFDNDEVSFDWEDLPFHDRAWLCFDLYVMGPWSGSQFVEPDGTTVIGPDLWTSYVNDDFDANELRRLIFTTFSNQEQYLQAFPAEYRETTYPYQTNAQAVGAFDGYPTMTDARYHFCYRLHHSRLSLNVLLKGLNLDALAHEKWAVDNMRIKIFYDAAYDYTYLPVLLR